MKTPAAMTATAFRSAQEALGWTNPKMADRLRVSLSTVEKWRSGAVPVPGTAAALLDAIKATELRAARRG